MIENRLKLQYFGRENVIVYVEYEGIRYDIHYLERGFYPNIRYIRYEYDIVDTYMVVGVNK